MSLHEHKPDGPRREMTGWTAFIDLPGVLTVTSVQVALGITEGVLIWGLNRGSWATVPVPWIYGPPLDVPLRRGGGVSYLQLFLIVTICATLVWGALASRTTWPRWPQGVAAVAATLLLPVHAALLLSLI